MLCDQQGREYYVENDDFSEVRASGYTRVDATFKLPRANSQSAASAHALDYSALHFEDAVQPPDEGDELALELQQPKNTKRKVKSKSVVFAADTDASVNGVVVQVYRYKHRKRGRIVLNLTRA